MKIILMLKINVKNRVIKNNKIVKKISFLVIIILIIYLSIYDKVISKTIQKKLAINFIKDMFKNHLNNNKLKESFNEYPNVSIIIPLYNCQNSIQTSIASIQIQKFKNYEIILINDHSLDNTSKIVNDIKENDHRIKLINNKKNMGTLYSRSIGALNSKGKYIFCLDNDDLFYDENLFDKIFNIAESKDFDIVEFNSLDIKRFDIHLKLREIRENSSNHHFYDYILFQPKLGIFPISKNNKYYPNDYHIWGKSIKTKIYKKAVNMLSEKNFSFYNCWTEDISILFIIFNIAQSIIFTEVYGIIHLVYDQSTTNTLHDSKKLMSEIFLLDIIIKYIQDIEINKSYLFHKLFFIMNSHYIQFMNIEHINYLNFLIKKMLQIKSLTEDEYKLLNKYMNILNAK